MTTFGAEIEVEDDEQYEDGCSRCGGSGFYVTCIDDICRSSGWCMHGDGERTCECQYPLTERA